MKLKLHVQHIALNKQYLIGSAQIIYLSACYPNECDEYLDQKCYTLLPKETISDVTINDLLSTKMEGITNLGSDFQGGVPTNNKGTASDKPICNVLKCYPIIKGIQIQSLCLLQMTGCFTVSNDDVGSRTSNSLCSIAEEPITSGTHCKWSTVNTFTSLQKLFWIYIGESI